MKRILLQRQKDKRGTVRIYSPVSSLDFLLRMIDLWLLKQRGDAYEHTLTITKSGAMYRIVVSGLATAQRSDSETGHKACDVVQGLSINYVMFLRGEVSTESQPSLYLVLEKV